MNEWQKLPQVSSFFDDKVSEIEQHLALLDILLGRHVHIECKKYNTPVEQRYSIEREQGHPFKAGAVLMIYNFMESISTALMQDIHAHIKNNIGHLTLNDLHAELKDCIVNHANKNELLKGYIQNYQHTKHNLDKLMIMGWVEQWAKEHSATDNNETYPKWFNGNVDTRKIHQSLQNYGLACDSFNNLKQGKAESLLKIKSARNRLAHGSTTFTEFGQDKSLDDIKQDFDNIKGFFQGLLNIINQHLISQRYLQSYLRSSTQ
jgi:hypothetical protein